MLQPEAIREVGSIDEPAGSTGLGKPELGWVGDSNIEESLLTAWLEKKRYTSAQIGAVLLTLRGQPLSRPGASPLAATRSGFRPTRQAGS